MFCGKGTCNSRCIQHYIESGSRAGQGDRVSTVVLCNLGCVRMNISCD